MIKLTNQNRISIIYRKLSKTGCTLVLLSLMIVMQMPMNVINVQAVAVAGTDAGTSAAINIVASDIDCTAQGIVYLCDKYTLVDYPGANVQYDAAGGNTNTQDDIIQGSAPTKENRTRDIANIYANISIGNSNGLSIAGGTTVNLLSIVAVDGKVWYLVRVAIEDKEYTGYIDRDHLAISNEEVLSLEERTIATYNSTVALGKSVDTEADNRSNNLSGAIETIKEDENNTPEIISNTIASSVISDTTASSVTADTIASAVASDTTASSVTADAKLSSLKGTLIEPYNRSITEDILEFPESYRAALEALKKAHPNWIFVAQNTGLDWNTVIDNEMVSPRSLVSASKSDAWGNVKYSSSWKIASRAAVEYCMDSRNYLSEQLMFAFEQLTFNASYHSSDATQAIIKSTFMSGQLPLSDMTYAQAFYQIGSSLGVSPYHLASRVAQEQGKGTSPLISGTYPGYEGYYNYFNISASGATNEAIYQNGLNYARNKGWDTPYKSIYGGSQIISANYILKGQDTLYLEKYDVDNSYSGMYTHQYMQNILAPRSEAVITYRGYNSSGAIGNTFVFKIPVYNNMPSTVCPDPDVASTVSPSPSSPTATVSPTATTSPSVTPAPSPTLAVPSKNPSEEDITKFVTRLYTLVLNREAEEAGLKDWVTRLKNRSTDGATAAYGFFESEEMKKRNLSNEDFVKICYKTMLGREADESGLKDWTHKLDEGMSRTYVLSGFTNSNEYQMICDDYGIIRGALHSNEPRDKNIGITGFVSRCYKEVLGREYDVNGLNDWTEQINRAQNQKLRAEQVASDGFFHSREFILKNTNNGDYVKILYRTFLGRDYDTAGYYDWLGQLDRGTKTRDEVLYGFSRSAEFNAIMQSYGIR